MKSFIAIESATPTKGYYSFTVYHIIKNKPSPLGSESFTYASTRGPDSEVMNYLSAHGHIPKKYTGYYSDHDNKPFTISYIIPSNQK